MRTIIELFGQRFILFIVLLLVVYPSVKLGLDSRWSALMVGAAFSLHGLGQFLLAQRGAGLGVRLGKVYGVFFMAFGAFMMVVIVAMFAMGQTLDAGTALRFAPGVL